VSSIQLSILIPAYNEEFRVCGTIELLEAYLDQQDYGWEILVVNDGSTDKTSLVVAERHPEVRLVEYSGNKGKGYATRIGAPQCKGEFILIYDADGSTPIEDVEKLWPFFDDGADIVIGSRAMDNSDVQVRQPLYRQSMGRIYNVLLRLLMLTNFKDTQCGFKGVRYSCVETVFPLMTIDGFGADCEMLFIAAKKGYQIEEVPVRWLNSPDTRVHPIFDSLDMIREVLIIRFKSLLGKYK
jgi:dolichyl-phosphate beta-glucosyltransferase